MSERRSFGGQPREDVCCSISRFRHNESVRVDDLERGVETEGGCLKRDPVGSVDVGSPGVYKKTRRGCRGRGGKPRSNYVPVTLESLQIDKDVQERNRVAAEFRVSSMSERDLHEIDVEVGDVQVVQDSVDASDFGLNSLALGDSCLQSGNGAARHQVGELDRGVGSPFESLITRAVVFGEKQHGYSYVDLLDPSRVSEAVRILGSGPTLRRLLRLGPSWFKPVFELNRIYIEVGSYCGTVVSAPQCDAAYARFWAVVRTMPEMELQAGWNALVRQSNSVRCHVPCVAHPGYVLY